MEDSKFDRIFNDEFYPFHGEWDNCNKAIYDGRWANYIIANLYRLSDDSIKYMYLTEYKWSESVYEAVLKEHEIRLFEKEFLRNDGKII